MMFIIFLAGTATGIVGMGLAQWLLAKPAALPLMRNARPCLIRVAGDTSFCQSCGAQWPVEDFAFCRESPANPHKAWLSDMLARAAAGEKAEVDRVLAKR